MTSHPKERRRPDRADRRRADYRLTEQRNPASKNLDRMTTLEIVRLMNREDRKVAAALGREIRAIARAVDAIVNGIRKGGRLIYAGAGSSGRMAVLDAAECAPTFGTPPKLVQALIAGGRRAETRRDDGGNYVEPAHAGGAAGEDRDFAGGGAGSVDGVDEAEGGDVAKDGAEHAEHGGDGAAGTCV